MQPQTDPDVPEPLRRELRGELAAARALPDADRIHDAEVALGTGGTPWPDATPAARQARLAAAMRALLHHRRPQSTICPSDAARVAAGPSWRDAMDTARAVAADLSRRGIITVRQHGADVDITTATGPIRLARGPAW
ncbi:DUF3253 domain-containing protein [Dactylosporangium sp. NPDC051541]|uniref:DUF3253 domain-containing protein n=1 Tax=Dactylosporangium sp. NPDC051541 TaxID=3363977 RepID=UPI0037A826B1